MQAFSALLGELDIDWEEELSRYTGDVVAHTLCSGARQARRFVGRELCRSQRQVAEYLTEEARLARVRWKWRASMTMSKSWPNR